jgi:hypothetical protein
MKRIMVTVLGIAAIGAVASPATAHDTSFNSEIQIEGLVGVTVDDYRYYGRVDSPKPDCVPGRTVKIFALTPEGRLLIDTDRTSRNGSFFGGGDFTPTDGDVTGVRVTVVKRNIGPSGHRHLCEADSDNEPIV